MTAVLITILALAGVAATSVIAHARFHRQRATPRPDAGRRRILFPFAADGFSIDALDCALRLARAEDAILVPASLARVSLILPLHVALPHQGGIGIELQDAIEQRARSFGVPVDPRIERGRTYRHALRQAIATERYDRIVIAIAHASSRGVAPEDARWLLDNAPGEIVVLRPNADTTPTRLDAPRTREPLGSFEPVK